jgi:hypothetical protein
LRRLYQVTLTHAGKRHESFDLDTSGTFDPRRLGKWANALEDQMEELCGKEIQCRVRLYNI